MVYRTNFKSKDKVPAAWLNENFKYLEDLAIGEVTEDRLTDDLQGKINSKKAHYIESSGIVANGSSNDVSYLLDGNPVGDEESEGIVVDTPYNISIMRDAISHDPIDDENVPHNEVYGRVTKAGSVWSLTYYSMVSDVETPYTFASGTPIDWAYTKVYNHATQGAV